MLFTQKELQPEALQYNRIAASLYRGRDPAFSDTCNPNAVINESSNDTASRAISWGLLLPLLLFGIHEAFLILELQLQ
ncbi:MAG: hypothetical protein EZS28_032091, partial [Streblomastix strix]